MEALKLIPVIAISLAVAGVVLGASLLTLSNFRDTMTENSTEYNATGDAMEGLSSVAEQQETIGVIAVMVIIISLIVGVFAYFRAFR